MSKHLDDMELECHMDGNLSWLAGHRVRGHLAECAECQARLEALRQRRDYLARMREMLARLAEADEGVSRTGLDRHGEGNARP